MSTPSDTYSINDHFVNKDPAVRKVYDQPLKTLRRFGPVKEEAKKTSIHLVNTTALAGVEVRKNYLLLNIKADHRIDSPRVEKTEQISARRFHHKVKLSSPNEIDKELRGWLKDAYELSG